MREQNVKISSSYIVYVHVRVLDGDCFMSTQASVSVATHANSTPICPLRLASAASGPLRDPTNPSN